MWGSALGCIVMLTLSMLVASLVAEAQQPTKVHRIGWLSTDFPPPASTSHAREEAFRQGLRALGYVEGWWTCHALNDLEAVLRSSPLWREGVQRDKPLWPHAVRLA